MLLLLVLLWELNRRGLTQAGLALLVVLVLLVVWWWSGAGAGLGEEPVLSLTFIYTSKNLCC